MYQISDLLVYLVDTIVSYGLITQCKFLRLSIFSYIYILVVVCNKAVSIDSFILKPSEIMLCLG